MRTTTHKLNLTSARALMATTALFVLAGLIFAFAPMRPVAAARQALAARMNASPTAERILSLAPASLRRAVKKQQVQPEANKATATPMAGAVVFAPVTITKDASPPSGSAVGQGQVIAYTIQATNGASSDTTTGGGGGGTIVISDTAPAGTLFTNVTVQQQPQFGSAWNCGIAGGGASFNCVAGDGGGPGVDTFTTQEFVKIRAEATVGAATPIGTVLTNTAVYAFNPSSPPVAATATSNSTVHVVQPAVDLAITKYAQTAQPPLPDPQNSVLAGGNSVGMASLGSIGNEGRGNISYVLTVSNIGGGNAGNVIIEDSVPGGPVQLSGVNAAPQDYPVAGPLPGPGAPPIIPSALGVTAVSIANDTGGPPVGTATTFAIGCHDFGAGALLTCRPGNNIAINPGYTPGVLPAGFQARIAYRLRVLASATLNSIVSNAARITSNGSADINAGNNTSLTTQNVVITKADLGITKATGNPTPVAGGAAFAYTLVVTNNGPSDALNIVVTDPLPAGIVLANNNIAVVNSPSIAGYGLTCTGPGVGQNGTVTCTGSLPGPDPNTAAVSTSTITLVVQAIANLAGGIRTNTATVSSATQEPSPDLAPNTASAQVTIANDASISIAKTANATACAGDNLTYNIAVTNAGNSSAVNVVVTDTLPASTSFVSVTGAGAFANNCNYNAGTNTVTCTAGFLPTGTSNITLVVRTAPNTASGPLANSALLSAAVGVITGTNPATATTTIIHCSDLEITKDDSPDAVLAGQDINYTITVKNVGPSDITGPGEFQVLEALPNPVTEAAPNGTIFAPGFSCNGLTPVTASFPCIYNAALPAGASVQIKFTLKVVASFNNGLPGGFIINTASVQILGLNTGDPNSQNNSSQTKTPIGPSADLAITKQAETLAGSVFGASVTAGGTTGDAGGFVTGTGEILYTLSYRNNGLGDATNVHIRDVVPAGTLLIPNFAVPLIDQTGAAVTCSVGIIAGIPTPTYQLDCTPTAVNGVLPANASGTIRFRVRVPENIPDAAVIKNVATINSEGNSPATPDPNGGNNTSNETQNIVRAVSDLTINPIVNPGLVPAVGKTGPASVIAGNTITYTVTVANLGPSNAQNVIITDALPAGVTFVSASSTDASAVCTNANNTVTCKIATLIAPPVNPPPIIPPQTGSNSATITIVGKVGANVPNGTVLQNSATVSSSSQDPNQTNNASNVVTTTVSTDSAVTIVKTDNPDPVVAGTNLTYTITVANNGPSDAQAVTVVDTLPPATQVQFLSASGTGVFSAANSCTQAANVVTCTAIPGGVFPAGATANITIVVRVLPSVPPNPLPQNPDSPAGLLNSATINWTDSNGVIGPLVAQTATDTEFTTVRHESDMAILKEAPDFGIAGSRIDYRLTLRNLGPSDVLGDNPPQGALGTGAGSIIVRDVLPLGTTLAPIAGNPAIGPNGPGGFTCLYTAATREVICRNAPGAAGNFPAGASLDFIIKVDIDSAVPDGSNLVNCATTTLRNTNPTPEVDPLGGGHHNDADVVTTPASGNNQSCDTTLVRTSADLAIGKSAVPVVDPDGAGPLAPVALPIVGPNVPPGSVNAGGYIRYDVPFGNNGPSDAINVLITDQIAGNTAFVGALATGGVFVPAAQPPAAPFTFTIQATDTVAPLGGPINLTCTVVGAAGTQSAYCRPQGNPTVANPNPPPATIAYADGTLPAGYNGTLTFFVKVNESVAGGTIVSNPANITSGLCPNGTGPVPPIFPPVACASTSDPNTANNTTLPTQTVVIASSNLSITKIVQSAVTAASNPNQTGPLGPATPPNGAVTTGTAVLPGTTLTYRITLTNNGPSDVSNIRLTDVLPSGLETPPGRVLGVRYISATPVLPSGATFICAPPSGIDPTNNPQSNGGSLVCTAPLLSANAPNNTAAIDVKVFIDPATKASLVDVATFDATINNFNRPVSGSTTLTTPVAPTSDLALTKTHTNAAGVVGGPVTAGTVFTYTVTLTNNGPSAAQMVSLVDTLPTFQQVRSIQIQQVPDGNGAPNFTCTATPTIGPPTGTGNNTTSITCTAPELPPNKNANGTVNPSGTVTFLITVRQDEATVQPLPVNYQNCVSVTSMSTDPVAGNSTNVCDTIPIIFLANPTGTKVGTPNPVIAGNLLTYTITATNPGPSAALNFRIIDPLPLGTVFISAVASPGASLTTPAVGANGPVTAQWDAAGGTPGGLTLPGVTRTLTIVVRVCPDFQQILNLTDAQMCVPNLTDTATITSDTPGTPATASFVSTVQAQSDLSIAKSVSPNPVSYSTSGTPSNVTYTITFANAGPSNANGVTITDILPKGFTVAPGANSLTSTVLGTTFTVTTGANGVTTVVANLGVLGAANQCQLTRPTSGTITIVARVPIKHPTITVTNQATIASTNCLPETGTLAVQTNPLSGNPAIITPGTGMLANNRAFADLRVTPPGTTPGVPYPALAEVSDQKEGSVLFYPIYTSDAVNANAQNTRISLTNTSGTERVAVHLFAVDGTSCSVLDAFICLTPNQTTTFLTSDFDPGNTGYIMAVAVEDSTGLPRVFNELIGDEYVKFSTGHAANLGAEAVAASMVFPAGVDPNVTTATLRFDGMNYNRLPRVLAADSIPSPADGNSTMLILDRVGGNFTISGATIGNIFGVLYDDSEQSLSFTANLSGLCQFRTILSNTFPRTGPPFSRFLPAGRTGWLKLWRSEDGALFGAQINFNPNAGINGNAFNQGHNLHKLALTDTVTVVVPILIPSC